MLRRPSDSRLTLFLTIFLTTLLRGHLQLDTSTEDDDSGLSEALRGESDSTLSVSRGGSVFIQPDDLRLTLTPTEEGSLCMVKVITDDRATLRVGVVEPAVFDCSFKENSVRYQHNGSPLLDSDQVRLTVFRFPTIASTPSPTTAPAVVNTTTTAQIGVELLSRTTTTRIRAVRRVQLLVTVTITESVYKILRLDEGRVQLAVLSASGLNGRSDPISPMTLQFVYDFDESGVNCFVSPSADRRFPSSGRLVRRGQGSAVVGEKGNRESGKNASASSAVAMLTSSSSSYDCRDFLWQEFSYEHRRGASPPSVDYLPISVETQTPGKNGGYDIINKESAYLKVRISGVAENVGPTVRITVKQPLLVSQFSLLVLTTDILSAADDETPDEHLIFNITSLMTSQEHGYFVNVKDSSNWPPLFSFTQAELASGQIAYHPPLTVIDEGTEIGVEFVTFDNFFETSEAATLRFLVLPSNTTSAPRVLINHGLVVVEGGSIPITVDDILILDSDNLDSVVVHIKGGPKHGVLEVGGSKTNKFTVSDITNGRVIYKHDNSDSFSDKISLKVSDGKRSVRDRLHVTILPLDDSPPYMATNIPAQIDAGSFVRLTSRLLSANDKDLSRGEKTRRGLITYVMTSPPMRGLIVKRHHALTRGRPVTSFTQAALDRGIIYYQHRGGQDGTKGLSNEMEADTMEFYLLDDKEPPNKSGMYTFEVKIHPSSNMSPHPISERRRSSLAVRVNASELLVLSDDLLAYDDVDSDESATLIYTITTQPYFLSSTVTSDAGRLVRIERGSDKLSASKSLQRTSDDLYDNQALRSFTQEEVDDGLIAYKAPTLDMETDGSRQVRFHFAVCDRENSCAIDQKFDVIVLPLSGEEESATVMVDPLKVKVGGTVRLNTDDVLVMEGDWNMAERDVSRMMFTVNVEPTYGRLVRNNLRLRSGDSFSMEDIRDADIRYINNGSLVSEDSFILGISTDGKQRRTALRKIPISVELKLNERPQVLPNLESKLNVDESGEVKVGVENLAATDNDTEDRLLNFVVVKAPELGEIRVGEDKVDRFSQGDISDGKVRYVHTSGEIGLNPLKDIATFTVLDDTPPAASETLPLLDLDLTVLPQDNSPPELLIGGPLLVVDGKAASITSDIVSARDVDSHDDALTFVVAQTPMWGFLERSKATSRSGRSQTSRRISSFTLSDLREGTIQYVPSNLSKGSPPSDSFFIYATDGVNRSPLSQVEVSVLPPNVRLPDFELANIVVEEGGGAQIRVQITTGSGNVVAGGTGSLGGLSRGRSIDTAAARLSVATVPLHGELVLVKNEPPRVTKETRFHDVTVEELKTPDVQLVYRHDGSETKDDRFVLSLSEGIHVVRRTCLITVTPVNDARPELVRAGPLYVDYGGTRLITDSALKVVDEDTPTSDIVYILLSTPSRGLLELDREGNHNNSVVEEDSLSNTNNHNSNNRVILEIGDNFTQAMVDNNRLRYTHTLAVSNNNNNNNNNNNSKNAATATANNNSSTVTAGQRAKGSDKFLFRVTDGAHTLPSTSTFLVEISLTASRRLLLHNRGMTLPSSRASRRTIEASDLKADDGGGRPSDVLFTVVKPPLYGKISLTDQGHSGINATSGSMRFTQADIDDGRVYYERNKVRGKGVEYAGTGAVEQREDRVGLLITSVRTTSVPALSATFRISRQQRGVVYTETEEEEEEAGEEYEKERETDRWDLLPTLVVNVPLTVVQGSMSTITSSNLRTTLQRARHEGKKQNEKDEDDAALLRYLIVELPKHGELLLRGAHISDSFTQHDVDTGDVDYASDSGDDSMTDYFLFTVERETTDQRRQTLGAATVKAEESGGRARGELTGGVTGGEGDLGSTGRDAGVGSLGGTGSGVGVGEVGGKGAENVGASSGYLINGTVHHKPAFFNILVQPLSKEPPKLVRNLPPERIESLGDGRSGFVISGEQLRATHQLFSADDITFTVKESPRAGTLEYRESGRAAKRKFTQRELNEGRIVYVFGTAQGGGGGEGGRFVTNDSFTFRVQDGNRNTLDDQRFTLHWSVVQFERAEFVVCEDIGTLKVKVTRLGSRESHVSVQVRAKQLSATEGVDFLQPSTRTIVFAAGVMEAFVNVEILNDQIENEENEKFKLLLRNPIDAILGDVNKAVVDIVEHGQCEGQPTGGRLSGIGSNNAAKRVAVNKNHFAGFQTFDSFDDYGKAEEEEEEEEDEQTDDKDDDGSLSYPDYNDDNQWGGRHGGPDTEFYSSSGGLSMDADKTSITSLDDIDWADRTTGWVDDAVVPEGEQEGRKESAGNERKKKKTKKREKMEHPLKKYRAEKTGNGGSLGWGLKDKKKGKGRGGEGWEGKVKGRGGSVFDAWKSVELRVEDVKTTTRAPAVQTTNVTPAPNTNTFAPQDCTRDTKGLLYFDLLSSKMFRCSGQAWEPWGWGSGEAYQYTALLKDASAAEREDEVAPGIRAEDDEEVAERRDGGRGENALDKKNKGRKKTSSCPPDWSPYESSCYKMADGKVSWNVAEEKCRSLYEGHLTDVLSRDHLVWLWELTGKSHFWIGLNDKKEPGKWRYTFDSATTSSSFSSSPSAASPTYFNWRRNFPRVNGRKRHCVMTSKRMEWVNRPCDGQKARYICVQPASGRAKRLLASTKG